MPLPLIAVRNTPFGTHRAVCRFYGKSQPLGQASLEADPSLLTFEQAQADYANLLWTLQREWDARDSPVIAFGGSYGGMLAAWMRRRCAEP